MDDSEIQKSFLTTFAHARVYSGTLPDHLNVIIRLSSVIHHSHYFHRSHFHRPSSRLSTSHHSKDCFHLNHVSTSTILSLHSIVCPDTYASCFYFSKKSFSYKAELNISLPSLFASLQVNRIVSARLVLFSSPRFLFLKPRLTKVLCFWILPIAYSHTRY